MHPFYRQARFLTSAARISQAPADTGMEVAFAGRSNAGKSSAINVICGQKNLARTSKTPGRTQLLNFFQLDDQRRLVDLPGYGYAKVAERVKSQWQAVLAEYLQQRRALRAIVLLMDIRHPMKAFDRQMLEWNSHHGLPTHILLTKADKLKRGAAKGALMSVRKAAGEIGGEVSVQRFSALRKEGLDEVYAVLDRWLAREGGAAG